MNLKGGEAIMRYRIIASLAAVVVLLGTAGQLSAQQNVHGMSPPQVVLLQLLMRQANRIEPVHVSHSACHPRRESYASGYGDASYGNSYADQAVQNELVATRAFWEKRRLRQHYLELERQRHMLTQQDVERLREHQQSLRQVMAINYEIAADRARRQAPGRAEVSDVNPVNGVIHWPASLRGPRFAHSRNRLESIFAQRAYYGEEAWDASLEIPQLTRSMRQDLKSMIRDLPSSEYVAAKSFLNKLEYESRFPPAASGLAAK